MAAQTQTQTLAQPRLGSQPNLASDLRVLFVIARKEWWYFVRYPTWWINMLVWPVIFPLGFVLSARALSGPDGSGLLLFTSRTGITDYLGYIAVGTTVWMWQNTALWGVGFALRNEQWRGTLETNWMTPSWRFAHLISPSAVHMVTMFIFILVSALEFAVFFGVRITGSLPLMLLIILLSVPCVYGMGMAFASLVISAKEAQQFVFMVRGLVMIFCGITFPVSVLPGWMQGVANWLPQTYMMHAVRAAAFTDATLADIAPDLLALAGFGAFWLAAGYIIFQWMERRARQTGAIGQY